MNYITHYLAEIYVKVKSMVHRGEIVEDAIRKSGITITQVAKRLGKSRRHIYNIFDDPNVPLETILQISKITHHDFSKEIPEIKPSNNSQFLGEDDGDYKTTSQAEYWKNKYLELLEKYNELLEKMRVS